MQRRCPLASGPYNIPAPTPPWAVPKNLPLQLAAWCVGVGLLAFVSAVPWWLKVGALGLAAVVVLAFVLRALARIVRA
jgi:hypothetical protein